ncbi:fibronectin type III-like domain-contianing protein [Nocardia gipuzkoensis]
MRRASTSAIAAWLRTGTEPAYPFGHGLGYTTWSFSDLTVSGRVATIIVRNTGDRAGKQVIQAYLSRPDSSLDRPVRWPAGFATVNPEPGESRPVENTLPQRAFEHWTDNGWATGSGTFTLHVGTSVTDLRHIAYVD